MRRVVAACREAGTVPRAVEQVRLGVRTDGEPLRRGAAREGLDSHADEGRRLNHADDARRLAHRREPWCQQEVCTRADRVGGVNTQTRASRRMRTGG
eukprot:1012793-Prymnesium_polylepis.1